MTKNTAEKISEKIKIYMLQHKITQRDLAKKLGVTPQNISHILNAKGGISTKSLDELAHALGTHSHYFFDNFSEIKGDNNIVGNNNYHKPENDLKAEILVIKKELEAHRYKLENLELKIEKIQKK